jgi:hypothetical protein
MTSTRDTAGLSGRLRASFLTGLGRGPAHRADDLYVVWAVIGWIDGWILPLIPA